METKNHKNDLTSIIIPTYNEIENIGLLIDRIDQALKKIPYEAVIVDDNSPDGTGEKAEELGKNFPVRVIHREGRLGLASAVLKGFELAGGNILGVMDADLSHPPEVIPELITPIRNEGVDVVVASRLVEGGGVVGDWPQTRHINSYVATFLAKPLTSIKDSMSGFFFLKRSVIENVKLIPRGYKIGLEILVKGRYREAREIPFIFDNRGGGKSKLNLKIMLEYLLQVGDLYFYRMKQKIGISIGKECC
jgi:dolichol-phosphate mannosyltransferase